MFWIESRKDGESKKELQKKRGQRRKISIFVYGNLSCCVAGAEWNGTCNGCAALYSTVVYRMLSHGGQNLWTIWAGLPVFKPFYFLEDFASRVQNHILTLFFLLFLFIGRPCNIVLQLSKLVSRMQYTLSWKKYVLKKGPNDNVSRSRAWRHIKLLYDPATTLAEFSTRNQHQTAVPASVYCSSVEETLRIYAKHASKKNKNWPKRGKAIINIRFLVTVLFSVWNEFGAKHNTACC